MGAIARSAANLITTSGVVLKGAVNNDSFDNVTALPSSLGDGITLISSQTASASATISFTSGIDSTYKAYKFVFSSIHPASNIVSFTFQGSTNAGSTYDTTMTTTYFRAYHYEDDSSTAFGYGDTVDQAQGTGFQNLANNMGSGNDENLGGELTIFNPSSTTYVKHFISRTSGLNPDETGLNIDTYVAGYFNTTSAINAIQFKYTSGNIDAGTIYMYGIK
jgi:hypothetical protein